MKKSLLLISLILLLGCTPAVSNEIEDDYFDISANFCILGDYNSAIEYLDKILQINPQNQKAIDLKKGLNHIISSDHKSFIENVNPLIKTSLEYKKVGDENKELYYLLTATKDENGYLAYYYLGNYYRSKGEYTKAITSYNASTSLRTDFAPAYLSTAVVLLDIGKFDSAINPLDKYLTFNPNDDLAYALKSRAEFALGQLERSKEDNLRAISINNCPEYQFDKAKILYMEGDYKKSKDIFTSLLKDIQTSKIYEYLGLCEYALENYPQALINFDKAILLSNDDEYLESKYNEIKKILEKNQNAQTSEN